MRIVEVETEVCNLTVFELHTFAVGTLEFLVHNLSGTSWATAKRKYWKNRAEKAVEGEFSPSNLERMKEGKPPLHDKLGVPMELHHKKPQHLGGTHDPENLQEVWPWEHDEIDPFRHYRGPRPEEIKQ